MLRTALIAAAMIAAPLVAQAEEYPSGEYTEIDFSEAKILLNGETKPADQWSASDAENCINAGGELIANDEGIAACLAV